MLVVGSIRCFTVCCELGSLAVCTNGDRSFECVGAPPSHPVPSPRNHPYHNKACLHLNPNQSRGERKCPLTSGKKYWLAEHYFPCCRSPKGMYSSPTAAKKNNQPRTTHFSAVLTQTIALGRCTTSTIYAFFPSPTGGISSATRT